MSDPPFCVCGAELEEPFGHRCPRCGRHAASAGKGGGLLARIFHPPLWLIAGLGVLIAMAALAPDDPATDGHRRSRPPAGESRAIPTPRGDSTDGRREDPAAASLGGGLRLKAPWTGEVLAVGFAERGSCAFAVGTDGLLRSWDVRDGSRGRDVRLDSGLLDAVVGTGDGSRLVTCSSQNRLAICETRDGGEILSRHMTGPLLSAFPALPLTIAADGSTVAYVDFNDKVGVMGLGDATARIAWQAPRDNAILAIALSGDGRLVALGRSSREPGANRVDVRETATGRLIRRMDGQGGAVLAIRFAPDGRRVVWTGKDRTLHVGEPETGREVARYGLTPGAGYAMAIAPDGRRALVGTGHFWDGRGWAVPARYGVEVWDVVDGRLLGRFETDGPVCAVAVSCDGRRGLCAGQDGGVQIWPMPGFDADRPDIDVAAAGRAGRPAPAGRRLIRPVTSSRHGAAAAPP